MKITQNTILEKGFHYKALPADSRKYRFELLRMAEIHLDKPLPLAAPLRLVDKLGRHWGTAYQTKIKIYPRYQWDGCSPKFILFKKFFGTPDFQTTILASLVHDFLGQSDRCGHYVPRAVQDALFRNILSQSGFPLSWGYFGGTKIGSFWFLNVTCRFKKKELD